MKLRTIDKLCCPFDKSDLSLTVITKGEADNIIEGILLCSECNRIYPIITGIPIMSPDEFRDFKLEQPLLEKWSERLNENSIPKQHVIVGKDQCMIDKK